MRFNTDNRIVMTLDAGGTNFVFSAVQAEQEIIDPISIPAEGEKLELVLNKIILGFNEVKAKLKLPPVAISFCFPGPAEYELGIIGDLENLPTFRGGVALGPMLEEKFGIPVFINNDGDLFAYGEAIAGLLPDINKRIGSSNSPKTYQNLLGVTFGTGYGGGIVSRGQLFLGDNSAQGEINRMRNKLHTNATVEENVSIRGIRRTYCRETGLTADTCPNPREIFEIGMGTREGNKEAAILAFHRMAEVAGDSIANAITMIDGLVVIGGGLSGAYPLFLQRLVDEMNSNFTTMVGTAVDRMEIKAFNLEDENEFARFYEGDTREIKVPFSSTRIKYDPMKRIGVGISRLGTSKAVSVGAYAFALNKLDSK
ncbi:MAG: ROK family protein [Bacteroidota bacterium]